MKKNFEIVDIPQDVDFDIEAKLNKLKVLYRAKYKLTIDDNDTEITNTVNAIITAFKAKDIDTDALISAIMPLWTFSDINKDEFHKQLKERIAKVLLPEAPQTKTPTIKGNEGGRLNTESL